LATGGANELHSGNFSEMQKLLADATTAFTEGRGALGAYQRNTLETRENSLANEQVNLMSAHSQIADADYALESSNLARSNVLTASSVEVLRIANQNASLVLGLLE
jgi:flagellin